MGDKILDSLLPKINRLAKLAKQRSLTADERREQKALRQRYLKRFRDNFRSRLLRTKFYDKNGNEVTSRKVRRIQRKKGWRHD